MKIRHVFPEKVEKSCMQGVKQNIFKMFLFVPCIVSYLSRKSVPVVSRNVAKRHQTNTQWSKHTEQQRQKHNHRRSGEITIITWRHNTSVKLLLVFNNSVFIHFCLVHSDLVQRHNPCELAIGFPSSLSISLINSAESVCVCVCVFVLFVCYQHCGKMHKRGNPGGGGSMSVSNIMDSHEIFRRNHTGDKERSRIFWWCYV